MLGSGFLIAFFAAVLVPTSVVYCALPATVIPLERAFPPSKQVAVELLRARDRSRHARILQTVVGGIVDFPVEGSSDPYVVGLYFTKVKLGSPPREFSVQIDTGSDILWITCTSCSNCPQTSGLGVQLNFFDAASSSGSFVVPCSDPMCNSAVDTSTQCSSESNQCSYSFQYGDGSGTSGYYVYDAMYFDMILGNSMIVNSSAAVVFGCSTYQSGDLTKTDKAVDGIFGFGRGRLSVISQLSSKGITPKIFSHCLKGADNGGGILVLGEILEPSIVYSPLVPSQPHYSLDLRSIAVNGQLLSIDPTVFETSGTIVDTGTTLAYLVEEAYDPLVNAITAAVSQFVTPTVSKGSQCYVVANSISDIFPSLSFNFAGGASMILTPEEYLIRIGFDNAAVWCVGFQKVQQGVSILGDLVMKDKIFVYDLVRQRIGWANYDCSSSVNVSVTSGKEFINEGQLRENGSSRNVFSVHIAVTMAILIQILSMDWIFSFFCDLV